MSTTDIRPTNAQIAANYLVIPQKFVKANDHMIDWADFAAIAFGEKYEGRTLDQCNRLRLRTRPYVSSGQMVRITIEDGRLLVEQA